MIRRITSGLAALVLLSSLGASAVAAGGPPGLAFYVDGAQWRTVGTPTDLSETGAPDTTYDRIYVLGGDLINVAEAKPGDTDFNGGRWAVFVVDWADGVTPMQATSDGQILAWEQAGLLDIPDAPAVRFVCPVIRVPRSWA